MTWPLVQLSNVCSFMTGGTPSTKDEANYIRGDIPWIVSGDIHLGEIFDVNKRITQKGMDESPAKYLPENSVLMALNGQGKTRATVALLRMSRATCNQSIVAIIPKSSATLDYRYLFVTLRSMYQQLRDMTGHANRAGLNMGLIGKVTIPLPPLDEQKKIAAILDAADELRQKDKALIAKYDELTQSLFLDMFGDPVSNQKGWEVSKLKDISTRIRSGNTPKGGSKVYVSKGITFFRSQNVWKNLIKLEDVVYIDEATHGNMKNSSLKHGDILMTKTGRFNTENSSLGRAAMYLGEDGDANVNGHVYLIRLRADVKNKFVLFILTTNQYRDYIRRVCVGGIDKRQINKEHLEEFPIIQPPVHLQEKFSVSLTEVQAQKALVQESLGKSESLFNSLLQKAFKGELTN